MMTLIKTISTSLLKKWSRNYNGEGEIHFRIITANTGTPVMVKRIQRKISTNKTTILLVCRGTTLDVIGKSIKVVSLHKKRPLVLKAFFLVLPNQVFPCFHCFSNTSPTNTIKRCHIFLFRGRDKWNVTELSHVSVFLF